MGSGGVEQAVREVPRDEFETAFRQRVRSQTEFGNEEKSKIKIKITNGVS